MAQSGGLAGVRGLLEHSLFLVSGASQSRVLALAEMVALSRAAAGVGRDVGGDCTDYRAMAAHVALRQRMDMGSGVVSVWHWIVAVFAVEPELQRATTGRISGSDLRASRAAIGDDPDSCTGAASGVFGTSL